MVSIYFAEGNQNFWPTVNSVFIVAEPRRPGGSPHIYVGEERFSAPKKLRRERGALALGTS